MAWSLLRSRSRSRNPIPNPIPHHGKSRSRSRSRRRAAVLAAAAALAVGLAASPANAAAGWESLPPPPAYDNVKLLPFDSQNSYATTKSSCWGCGAQEELWQRSGSTWKKLTPPADAAAQTLAGTGPDDLWAIGRKDLSSGIWHVHHYDGTKWSADLHPDTRNLEIRDAEAVSRTSLWGVGNNRTGGWAPTVTHWDGRTWNTTTFPVNGGLDAVDVRSENDIWAAGYRSDGGVPAAYDPLVMHYDGTRWSEVPLPGIPGENDALRTVFSNGPNDVWVASDSHEWHWDGTAWARRDLPGAGYGTTFARYGGQVYAGTQVADVRDPKLLRWSGTSWVADTSLTKGTSVRELSSSPDGALYAVSQSLSAPYTFLSRLAPPAS
ncbi:hypothetical protein [Streptomyces sp. NPDC055060]